MITARQKPIEFYLFREGMEAGYMTDDVGNQKPYVFFEKYGRNIPLEFGQYYLFYDTEDWLDYKEREWIERNYEIIN
jgi:hypothetical protein